MIKQVVSFGDSFVWGDELLDPGLEDHENTHPSIVENIEYRESNCFTGRIAKHYDIPQKNFGIPGGSLQSTIWTYLWWMENDPLANESLVLVGLTEPSRHTFYNPKHVSYANDPEWNRFVHSAWVHNNSSIFPDEWVDMVKKHTTLTWSKRYFKIQLNQSLTFFNNARHEHPKLLQFFTIPNRTSLAREFQTLPNLHSCVELLEDVINNGTGTEVLKPNRHPNEKGHRFITNWLLSELDML